MADRFLEWVVSLPTGAIYAVLVALSALENVFPPVPADVAVVLGGFLSRGGHVSAPFLGVLCWAGNTVTAAGMYYLGRRHGEAILRIGWVAALMPPEARTAVAEAYGRHGVWGIFASRFLPGVRATVTPFAGVLGLPPARTLLPAATASAIWYAFLVAAGSVLARNWEAAKDLVADVNRALAVVALAATALFAAWLWRRSRR